VAEESGPVPSAAPGGVNGDPQDFRPAGRFPGSDGDARDRSGVGEDPGFVADGIALDPGGHIIDEVVRQAPDDGRGGGDIRGREAADGDHVIHRASTLGQDLTSYASERRVTHGCEVV
jgi:hypothetical protein